VQCVADSMQVEQDRQWVLACPPYLIGVATLFWGIMVEHEFVGFGLAVMFEAFNFVKTRWNFSDRNVVRAWHMSVIISLLIAGLYWVDGAKPSEMRVVFEWLPMMFAPLLFVQRYGESDVMLLNTFSVIARSRMKADLREGRPVNPYVIDFSSIFFALVLLSSGLKRRPANFYDVFSIDVTYFYIGGIVLLIGLFVFLVGKRNGRGAFSFILVYGLMVSVSVGALSGLKKLESRLMPHVSAIDDGIDIHESSTGIGSLGKLKLSNKVKWRMWVPQGKPVRKRIPFAIYNVYNAGNWQVSYMTVSRKRSKNENAVRIDSEEGEIHFFSGARKMVANVKENSAYRFISTLESNRSSALMPHLNGYFAYGGIVGEESSIERTLLGSVQIFNPEKTLHCYIWDSDDPLFQYSKPLELYDELVPQSEQKTISIVVDKLGLREMELAEMVDTLRSFFQQNFTYTKHLDFTGDRDPQGKILKSALSKFLTETKEGHCEYFATATTLLLREAGIPARYINGFGVKDLFKKSEDPYLLRGNQIHAWSQAWNGERWIDVDLTPAQWQEEDTVSGSSLTDKIADWWKMTLEDFQVWREDPENAKLVNNIIFGIIGLVVVWIFIRLWFAKNKSRNEGNKNRATLPDWKIMKKFDRWCIQLLGRRPSGMAYGEWVSKISTELPEKQGDVDDFVGAYHQARFSKETDQIVEKIALLAKQIMKKR